MFDLRGRIALAEDRPEEALVAAEDWLAFERYENSEGGLWQLLVNTYRSLGRLDDAATVLTNRLRYRGGGATGHYELGQVWEQLERFEEARGEYELSLELWADADRDLPEVPDAQRRVEKLKLSE